MAVSNNVSLIGRLTRDVELKKTNSGTLAVEFNLAINRGHKDKDGVEADFPSCKAYGKIAENMARYLQKGSKIAVQGRIHTRNFLDKQRNKVYVTEVIADNVEYLETLQQQKQNNNNYNNYNNNQRNNNNGFDNFFNDKSKGNARSNFSDFGQDFPSDMDDDFLSDVVNPFSE